MANNTTNTTTETSVKECKNPFEIFNEHTKQTFFVQAHMANAAGDDENPALENHHRKFSRFSFGIINAAGVPATANLNVANVPGILERARAIKDIDMKARLKKEMSGEKKEREEEEISKAYTVKISSGALKGQTPAQVLLEKGDEGRKMLSTQGNYLYKNREKYPGNVKQIEAIAEAIGLYDHGQLKEKAAEETKKIVIPLTFKSKKEGNEAGSIKSLKRRTRPNGKAFVYQLTLEWHVGAEQPFVIKIMNCYAPLAVLENGLLAPQLAQKESAVTNTFALSMDDFEWLAHQMEASIRIFEDAVGKKNLATAYEQNSKNLKAAGVKARRQR